MAECHRSRGFKINDTKKSIKELEIVRDTDMTKK